MPLRVLIIHGTKGSPEGNWFPWLRAALEKDGHDVRVPRFPTPEGQSFESWRAIAETELKDAPPAETLLVGHSTGAVFVLRLAEQAPVPFRAVFSVCPFAADLGLAGYDELNATFVRHDFNWPRVRAGAKAFFFYAGDNDPYVPLRFSQDVAVRAAGPLAVIPRGGHLNSEHGVASFGLLLRDIRVCAGGLVTG